VSIHPQKNASGDVTSVRAVAAKIDGKQLRRSFSLSTHGTLKGAESAARKWIRQERLKVADDSSAEVVSGPDMYEWKEAGKYLATHLPGTRISEAIRGYVAYVQAEAKSQIIPWTFRQAVTNFIQTRKDAKKRPEYLRSLDDNYNLMIKTFGDRALDDIKTEEMEAWLRGRGKKGAGISPTTWRNYRRDFRMLFRFAIRRERASRNPANAIVKPEEEDAAVKILTAEQVNKLLEAADQPVQVYIAIQAFAGIRPFEVLKLTAKSIISKKGVDGSGETLIEVMGLHSKSRSRGLVTVSPNLCMWLNRGVEHLGKIRDYWTLRRLTMNAATSSKIGLPPDVLRHSFASHYLALHKDAATTAYEMRHRNQQMLFERYREVVTPEEASAYFSVVPPP
jgi:integrase